MKIELENIFLTKGSFANSLEYTIICQELREAIQTVCWCHPEKFIINPILKGNGVVPIKNNFIAHLLSKGWLAEQKMSIVKGMNPGPIDIIKKTSQGIFAVEWETGNISSSHRALNKIAVGIIEKAIIGGILILPKKTLARYLTDRIGNYEEIEPYITLYHNLNIEQGVMGIIAINYDETCEDLALIPKGNDGNAKKVKSNLIIP